MNGWDDSIKMNCLIISAVWRCINVKLFRTTHCFQLQMLQIKLKGKVFPFQIRHSVQFVVYKLMDMLYICCLEITMDKIYQQIFNVFIGFVMQKDIPFVNWFLWCDTKGLTPSIRRFRSWVKQNYKYKSKGCITTVVCSQPRCTLSQCDTSLNPVKPASPDIYAAVSIG